MEALDSNFFIRRNPMSRSFQKTPGWTGKTRSSKFFKRQANKKVRKDWNISNGKQYKKKYCSYIIKDWVSLFYNDTQLFNFYCFIEDYVERRGLDEKEAEREFYRAWTKK
jgi:hypothetical protein